MNTIKIPLLLESILITELERIRAEERNYWQNEIHKLCPYTKSLNCLDGMLHFDDGNILGSCEWHGHVVAGHT